MLICLDMRTGAGCGAENLNHATHCSACRKPLRFALALHDSKVEIARYRVVRVIGYGAYGAVYEAAPSHQEQTLPLNRLFNRYTRNDRARCLLSHTKLRRVALKETFDASSISSFTREFKLLKGLEHPNLPRYIDMFEAEGNGYLVMEYVAGQSLQEVLDEQIELLSESQVKGYALQLCDVLEYLHSQQPPILHRDIKPANIRLTPEGRIKLVDFGLLKQGGYQTRATIRGLGTPAYAPLEQYGDEQQVTDVRSDIYSLGATLYHLLCGQEPLSAPNRLTGDSEPLPPLPVTLSSHVKEAVMKAMSLMPKARFRSINEFRQALAGVESSLPKGAPTLERLQSVDDYSTKDIIIFKENKVNYFALLKEQSLPHLIYNVSAHVLSMSYSADGQHLYCMTNERDLLTWRVIDGQLINTLSLTGKTLLSRVAISPDGQTVAGVAGDLQVRIWRMSDGQLLHKLRGHTGQIQSLAYTPDGKILASAGGDDESVRLWQVVDGQLLHIIESENAITCLAFSPTARYLAYGSFEGIELCRLADGKSLRAIKRGGNNEQAIKWSPDEQFLLCGHLGNINLCGVADGQVVKIFKGHTNTIIATAWSPDSQTVISGGEDKTIRIWSVAKPSLQHLCWRYTDKIRYLVYSPDGQSLASASDDGTVRLWLLQKKQVEQQVKGPQPSQEVPLKVESAPPKNTSPKKLFQDNAKLIAPSHELSLPHLRCLVRGNVLNLAVSPDGQTIVAMTDQAEISKWGVADGTLYQRYSLPIPSKLFCLTMSPDRQTIASASDHLAISLWRASDGQLLHQLHAHIGVINALAYSPNGRMLASSGFDKTVRLWRVAGWQQLLHSLTQKQKIYNMSFSPTGQLLAGGNGARIELWRVADGKQVAEIQGGNSYKHGVCWSPDQKMLVYGKSKQVQLVRVADGQPFKPFKGHSNTVVSVAWHPNGQLVASGSSDDTIRIWSLRTSELRYICQGHRLRVTCLAFSPDGRVLASGSPDGTVRLWQLPAP